MDYRIFNVCTDVNACGCTRGVYGHCERVCTESWLWEKNPLPHQGIEPASAAWLSDVLTELHSNPNSQLSYTPSPTPNWATFHPQLPTELHTIPISQLSYIPSPTPNWATYQPQLLTELHSIPNSQLSYIPSPTPNWATFHPQLPSHSQSDALPTQLYSFFFFFLFFFTFSGLIFQWTRLGLGIQTVW